MKFNLEDAVKINSGGVGAIYLIKKRGRGRNMGKKYIIKGFDNPISHSNMKFFSKLSRKCKKYTPLIGLNEVIDSDSKLLTDDKGYRAYASLYVNGITLDKLNYLLGGLDKKDRYLIIKFIFKSIFEGIKCIHQEGFFHSDIKPKNIMLTIDGQVKIIDIDSGCCLEEKNACKNMDKICSETTDLGWTPSFCSPEHIISKKKITYKSDYFSIVLTLLNILFNKNLFHNETENLELMALIFRLGSNYSNKDKLKTELIDNYIKKFNEVYEDNDGEKEKFESFILSVLIVNIDDRLNINEILSHSFFKMTNKEENKCMKLILQQFSYVDGLTNILFNDQAIQEVFLNALYKSAQEQTKKKSNKSRKIIKSSFKEWFSEIRIKENTNLSQLIFENYDSLNKEVLTLFLLTNLNLINFTESTDTERVKKSIILQNKMSNLLSREEITILIDEFFGRTRINQDNKNNQVSINLLINSESRSKSRSKSKSKSKSISRSRSKTIKNKINSIFNNTKNKKSKIRTNTLSRSRSKTITSNL